MRVRDHSMNRPVQLRPGRLARAMVLSLFMLPGMAMAEGRSQDDLLAVVQETLETNPEVLARMNAFDASVHDRREVFGGYLPSIDVNASVGRGNREYDQRGDFTRNYAEISLTQMLFDGFRVRNRLDRFEHTSRVRYYELLDEAETKALEASDAYLSVLRHRELVALAQKNVANHLRVQQHVEQRAGSGVGNRADLEQIQGRLALARTNLMTEIANLQSVTARFQRLVGRLPAEVLAPVTVADQTIPGSLDTVLQTSYANSPALYAAFENIGSAEAALREAKATRYPTFELGLRQGIYRNNNGFDNRSDPDNYGSENIIELRGRYNLYRGGSDRAAQRAAHDRIGQAESLRDKACVDLRQNATLAYTDLLNLNLRTRALVQHREASAKVVAAYREQFDIGRRTLLDVLDSENEAFQADRSFVNGHYDLQTAKLRTLHSMGRLLQTLSLGEGDLPTLEDLLEGEAAPSGSRYCTLLPGAAQLDVAQYSQVEVERPQVLQLSGDALFDVGSAVLKPAALQGLDRMVRDLLQRPGALRSVNIVGHTDSTGRASLNRDLSLARAMAVRDYLVIQGVPGQVVTVEGRGADQPVASNDTASGRAANRRVELQVQFAQ